MWDVHDVKRVGKSWSNLYHGSCVWGLEVGPATFDPSMLVLPPGSFITSSADDTIRIWNIDPHMKETKYYKQNVYSHELLKVMYVDPSFAYLRDVDYNPAGGTDKTDTNLESKMVYDVWGIHDLRDQTELQNIEAHDQEVMSVQYSNIQTGPSLLASSGRDRLLHIYDVEQGYGTIQSLYDHSSTVTAIKFSDSENQLKLLSSSADKSVLFRNAQQSPEFQFVLGNQHVVGNNTLYDMDIDLAQKFLAVACQDRNIRVYDIKTAKQKKCYKGTVGDSGPLIRLQLDPSGQYAVTSSLDKNLCILDFTSGEILATMFGHSDAPTGVKFMNDLKHVVSVSGDSCIFVWRLPTEMTKQMQNKLEELGQLPLQAINTSVNNSFNMHEIDESLGRAPLFPNEQGFSSPSKILAQLQKKQEEKEREEARNSPDFRYSVGPLPKWAKAQTDSSGLSLFARQNKNENYRYSQDCYIDDNDEDEKIYREVLCILDQKARKFQLRDASPDTRRQTMVLSKPENTPRKVPMVSDDKDDDDDDVDAFKEEIIYPPSENGTDTDDCMFTVFTGKEDTTRRTRQGSIGRNVDAESSSTDPVSLDDVEEEEEIPSAPVTPCDDDVTLKASGRKYLREQYENLNFSPTPMDKFEKGLDKMEQSMEDNQPSMFSTRASISSKFLSKAQQANIRNMSVYGSVQRQDNWFDSVQRRKDEMARAVDETRKRLMAMGWKDESPESPPSNTSPGSTSPTNKVGKKVSPPGPHTPKSLRRCWSTFDLPKQPIIEEKANMNLNYSKSNPSTPVSRRSVSVWDKPMESDSEESTSSNPRKSATRQSRPTTLSVSNRRKQDTKETKPESRYPLRSQSQGSLYRRSTESSKAKTSKTGPVTTPTDNKKPLMKSRSITNVTNLSKSNSTQNLASKTNSEKPKAPPRSSKLKPTAKSTFYSSTPNLAGLDDTDDEDFTVSNLRLCADISLSSSTPDLLDDDTVSVDSQSTDSEREKPSSGRRIQPDPKRFSTGTPSRVSAQRTDARKSLPGRKLLSHATASDRDLMPPPSSTSVLKTKGDSSVVKSKQEIFLKRAMQTRKRTTFELTFDQAKEILKGKSGILTGESSSFEKTKTTSTVSYSTSNSTTTTSCSHSTSVSPSISSSVTTYSSVTPKRNIPKVTSPPIHLTPNQIMIESEIDSTAAEIRRQNMIDSAFQNLASLEAYPDDIPERDYNPSTSSYISPSLPSVSNTSSSTNIQQNYQLKEARTLPTHHRHSPPSHIDTDENDSDTPSKSVRERIAQLNAHNSPRSSEQRRGQPSSSQVTYGPGQGTMQASPGSGL
ncbi:hypothetical protein FSP39_015602 [Pinctada imbricata]|uniref:MABP1/WDR62 second WD40 domain-containing protein n=1 Tax=Pinctada imbricata TaxID=66713 RepID=A0AA88XX23_PINIB|nr:hypothetical protein FSP39_015602 [Pinctada imbricata]